MADNLFTAVGSNILQDREEHNGESGAPGEPRNQDHKEVREASSVQYQPKDRDYRGNIPGDHTKQDRRQG